MALLKFKHGLAEKLNDLTKVPVSNGTVYITTDSQEMKVDIDGKRLTISDFVSVSAAELDTVAIYDNLFYYVTDTKAIVKYVGTDAEGKRIWEGINNTDQIAGMNTRLITAEGDIDALQTADEDLNDRIDGLNAGNIDTTDEIVVTKAVGNYAVGKKISADTSIQDLLLNMLCADSAPGVTGASISLKNANNNNDHTYIEVGSSASLTFTATFDDGNYPYGYALNADGEPDTVLGTDGDKATGVKDDANAKAHPGVTASAFSISYNSTEEVSDATKTSLSKAIDSGIQTTAVEKNASASVTYGNGYIPVSILKNKYQSKRIAGATKTASCNGFRWYEPVFSGFKYEGALIDNPETITAAQIAELNKKVTGSSAWSKTAPSNEKATGSWRQYFVAIPVNYGKELTKIVDTTNQPLAFKKKAQNVSVTLGTATVEYEVFYVSFPSAFDTVEFNLTW